MQGMNEKRETRHRARSKDQIAMLGKMRGVNSDIEQEANIETRCQET